MREYDDYADRPIVKGSAWIPRVIVALFITLVICPAAGFFVWYTVAQASIPILSPEIAPVFSNKWGDTAFFTVAALLGWGMEAAGLLIIRSLIRKPKEGEEWQS